MTVEDFRPDIPSTARMYDYYLGGKDNFRADRVAAERIIARMPDGMARNSAVQNRKFLMRVVRSLASEFGVRQFLDIGTGLPAVHNVHEVVQAIAPESRVVYVDHDPLVITHGRDLLHGNDRAVIIEGDARDPGGILADPSLRTLLDFREPIAVLFVAILHFLTDDDDPYGIVRAVMAAVPVGSYLVVSHFTADGYPRAEQAARVGDNLSASQHSRTRAQVAEFFDGHDLLPPGEVVWTPQWRPDRETSFAGEPGNSLFWCGVARKFRPGAAGALPPPAATAEPDRLSGWSGSARPADGEPRSCAVPDPRFSPEVPNVARMYDYYLGGKDNYPADRAAAEAAFAIATEAMVRGGALENRKFLGRAVRYLARDLGMRQFLDIGTGLPTMNNVHEVAHSVAPGASVVYVDNDPIVIAHGRDMLNGVPNATIVSGDLREPAAILANPVVRSRLDFGRPIALLLVAVLHFLTDEEDPRGIVAALMDALPPGSYLVVSHVSADRYRKAAESERAYDDASAGLHFRGRAEIEAMLDGLRLVDPGELVWAPLWHPDEGHPDEGHPDDGRSPLDRPGGAALWCGIARK